MGREKSQGLLAGQVHGMSDVYTLAASNLCDLAGTVDITGGQWLAEHKGGVDTGIGGQRENQVVPFAGYILGPNAAGENLWEWPALNVDSCPNVSESQQKTVVYIAFLSDLWCSGS